MVPPKRLTMAEDREESGDALAAATLRWLHDHADRGIFATDVEFRIRSWNTWLANATGLASDAVIGRPVFEVFPSLLERGFDQHYAEALAGQVKILSQPFHKFIIPTSRPGGGTDPVPQRGQIGPLTDGNRIVGTITIVEDVSERVSTERELRARIAAAEAARVTAETASRVKDEFLATLSHEIRTPLNAVLGWTRILRNRDFDENTVRRAVEVIDRNASAQLTLIGDLLDMARIAAGKVRLDAVEVDLAALASAALDVVRPAADAKAVTLVPDFAAPVPPVSGDRDRLLQVIWNLLSNAVKFTDRGGRVVVSISTEADTVCLAVSDNGQGIEADLLTQVFERFKQADASSARRHGGLGLGLALVRELVEMHGGTVKAESPGRGLGSTFTVRLPIRSETARPAVVAPRRKRHSTAALGGVNILLVEDDPDSREILIRSVSDVGAAVTAVSSVAEALAALRDNVPPDIDVVLTDIGMPGDDGYSFLQALRRLPPDRGGKLPAIAVTAYATGEDRRRALQAGFFAHLAKPFDPVTLIATIGRAVASRSV
jgi:PAS domain S-box-containing protein